MKLEGAKQIETLDSEDFQDIKPVLNGYHFQSIPESTGENMVIMMNKINELIEAINAITKVKSTE